MNHELDNLHKLQTQNNKSTLLYISRSNTTTNIRNVPIKHNENRKQHKFTQFTQFTQPLHKFTIHIENIHLPILHHLSVVISSWLNNRLWQTSEWKELQATPADIPQNHHNMPIPHGLIIKDRSLNVHSIQFIYPSLF